MLPRISSIFSIRCIDNILTIVIFMKYTFFYSDISKIRIFKNVLKAKFFQLLKKRFVKTKVLDNEMILDLQLPGISKALFVYGKRELLDTEIIRKDGEAYVVIISVIFPFLSFFIFLMLVRDITISLLRATASPTILAPIIRPG